MTHFTTRPTRRRIKGGITCAHCHHVRFKWMEKCPKCEWYVTQSFDTSTKELIGGHK